MIRLSRIAAAGCGDAPMPDSGFAQFLSRRRQCSASAVWDWAFPHTNGIINAVWALYFIHSWPNLSSSAVSSRRARRQNAGTKIASSKTGVQVR